MNLLKRTTENKKSKLVGRGGSRGKTSGRGTKGQKARAGHKLRPEIRDMIKKYPKLRGRGKNINRAFRADPATINIGRIASTFKSGDHITPSVLLDRGIIRRKKGVLPMVKILATGEISYPVEIYDCDLTPSARTKIVAAGGIVK